MLLAAVFVFAALALVFLVLGAMSFRSRRPVGGVAASLLGLVLLLVGTLLFVMSAATQGYRALTREEVAATVIVRPVGDQRFEARFVFPDGRETTYMLAGDQVYVDAHILKWKPVVNVLGLHTQYELDRVGGRYMQLQDERQAERTVHSLSQAKRVDMFPLRQRYSFLAPLLDAEYGSGTFIGVDTTSVYEVRVSTSGLLIRPGPAAELGTR